MTTSTSTAAANGAPEQHSDDEALSVLLDADIDKVMAGLDRIVEAAPSYEKLFMRWQRQQWTTEDFDLSVDRRQWDSGGEVRLWDADTGRLRGAPLPFSHGAVSVAFDGRGKILAAAGDRGPRTPGEVTLWDLEPPDGPSL